MSDLLNKLVADRQNLMTALFEAVKGNTVNTFADIYEIGEEQGMTREDIRTAATHLDEVGAIKMNAGGDSTSMTSLGYEMVEMINKKKSSFRPKMPRAGMTYQQIIERIMAIHKQNTGRGLADPDLVATLVHVMTENNERLMAHVHEVVTGNYAKEPGDA